jgi:NADH-quinone oxidoreductase subunit L
MFVAAGVGAYPVAMFHLFTHAFFKAMLFLGAGSVIHAMHHEQDMRNYGNLRKKIPYTFWAMMIGTLAITGVGIPLTHIGFAGYLSKDAIIESAYAGGTGVATYAYIMLVIAACFTSFYSWRLIFMTFFGTERGDPHTHEHAHESPMVMIIPLGVLALGAIFAGMFWYEDFFGHHVEEWFEYAVYMNHETNHVIHDAHNVPKWVKVSPFVAMLVGFIFSWMFYIWNTELPKKLAAQQRHLYQFLLNKWYFDELYDAIFVRPAKWLGTFLWKKGDGAVIDGALNGLAMNVVPWFTRLAGRAQSGYLFHYAFAMFVGLAAIITWFAIGGGAH